MLLARSLKGAARQQRTILIVAGIATAALANLLLYMSASADSDLEAQRAAAFISAVSAVTSLMVVILTSFAVADTRDSLRESRAARRDQSRPQVLVSFEMGSKIELVVGHYGGGPARDIEFDFKPPLVNSRGDDITAEAPFSTGIPLMVSGERQRVEFDYARHAYDKWVTAVKPDSTVTWASRFAVTIKLSDPMAGNSEYMDCTPNREPRAKSTSLKRR